MPAAGGCGREPPNNPAQLWCRLSVVMAVKLYAHNTCMRQVARCRTDSHQSSLRFEMLMHLVTTTAVASRSQGRRPPTSHHGMGVPWPFETRDNDS